MNAYKKNAVVAGVLFIIGTVSGIISATSSGPLLKDSQYLIQISPNENQVIIAAFFQFIMAVSCAGIAISLYPVLKKFSVGLALGAVGFRLIEGVLGILGALSLLLLLTLGKEFIKAGVPAGSYFQTVGSLIITGHDWLSNVFMLLTWCIGALMYYYIFYKTKLIPRWLSIWGLVGAALCILTSILVMLQLITPFGTIQVVFNVPIAIQEMVLAICLIVKGFNASAITALSAKQESRD